MLSTDLGKHLENALRRFAHLEALAHLFHAITKDGEVENDLFRLAREDLNRNFPDNTRIDAEITRLAGVFSAAYQDETPCPVSILAENPLLVAAALGKQIGASFLSSTCPPIKILDKCFYAFKTRPSLLHKDWTSPRRWFQPIWFVGTPANKKEVKISCIDWHDGTNPTCALIEFDDEVGLDMETEGDTFIVRGLSDEKTRWNSLVSALQIAHEAKAQILVLPELTLTPALLEKLSAWLNRENSHPFRLIAAGSYHYRDTSDVLARNRMMVLDRRGVTLFHHDKWFEYNDPIRERISLGTALHLLFSPSGLLSFVICKDFCELDGFTWKAFYLDGLCVASMGGKPTLSAHGAAARIMKIVGSRVLLANATKESDGKFRGFFSLPNADPQTNIGNVTLRAWNGEKQQLKVVK